MTDDAHVYAVDYFGEDSRIVRMNLDGKEPIVLATKLAKSKGLSVAGDFVYYAAGAKIRRTSK